MKVQKNGVNSCVVTVSCPIILKNWLENSGLSASALFQEKLIEEKRRWDNYHTDKSKLEREIDRMDSFVSMLIEFLDTKGIKSEFVKFKSEKENNVLEQNKKQ
jgi:hypothetical protein